MATVDPILEITDGTTTVNLLNNVHGFGLVDWTPKVAELKGGGTFVSSSLAEGRRLALKRYDNVIETFNLRVHGSDQDMVAGYLRDLRQLLEKARDYWTTNWTVEPVWIKAQGPHETYPRYAIIHNWSTPQDDNPFVMPFFDCGSVLADEFTLLVEREPFWSDDMPGSDSNVLTSVVQTFDGRNYGNVDENGDRAPSDGTIIANRTDVFVANKHNTAQLTDVYEDDGGVWSSNLLDASLPHRILPSTPAVNDAIYLGIDTSVTDSGPFNSLVFNIGVALGPGIASDITITWEYWNGASWTAFVESGASQNLMDRTLDFTNVSGYVNTVTWLQPSDWATRNLSSDGGPAITGYFIRARVSAIGASPSGAQQYDFKIYTVTWPYIELQSDQITGDLPALIRFRLHGEGGDGTADMEVNTDKVTIATRAVDRGNLFTPFVMASDEQIPQYDGNDIYTWANVTYVNDMLASTGRCGRYSPLATEPSALASAIPAVEWAPYGAAQHWNGLYRLFLRVRPVTNVGGAFNHQNHFFRLVVRTRANIWSSPMRTYQDVDVDSQPTLIDFGLVKLPPTASLSDENPEDLTISVKYWTDDATNAYYVYIYELITLPADEYIGSFGMWSSLDDDISPTLNGNNWLDIDSTKHPKVPIYTPAYSVDFNSTYAFWLVNSAEEVRTNKETHTRVYFLCENPFPTTDGAKFSHITEIQSVQMFQRRQYYSAIGGSL